MSLESMIRACLQRDGQELGLSTTVAVHLSQMRDWGTRGGALEFRPVQDDERQNRIKFISRQHQRNRMRSRLNYVMDCFVSRGEICWFFLPDPKSPGDYIIDFFVGGLNHPDPEFKVYYAEGGREIEKVIIVYDYDQHTAAYWGSTKRWVTLVIDKDSIRQSESTAKPSFNQLSGGLQFSAGAGGTYGAYAHHAANTYPNPFAPNLPVRISKNNARRQGQQGSDDFYWIKGLIEDHEELVLAAHTNLKMFSNPSMVTTRSAHEVLENSRANIPQTWASASRYVDNLGDIYSGSTHPSDSPAWGMSRTPTGFLAGGATSTANGNIARIIGGVGEGERFGYIQADAVSGDQNLWIRQIRELIHWSLGGVDPLGISSGATFGEIRTLFGRVQNTADLKAQALYTEGLCEVYEQCIAHEEERFRKWLFATIKQLYPDAFAQLVVADQLTDELCQEIAELAASGIIRLPKPQGLLPFGDRTVTWRFTRQVFQLTTREELDRSIAARNEREDGLSQEWVLRKQYPDMTDQEIKNAMSGFSPRVVQSANGAIGALMQLFQMFMQIPDPDPEVRRSLPKGADPPPWGLRLGLPQLVEQAMLTLQKEISYGQPQYEPDDEEEDGMRSALQQRKLSLEDVMLSLSQNGTLNDPRSASSILGQQQQTDLSTYGLPSSVVPLLLNHVANQPITNNAIRQPSSALFPSPGATATGGELVSDARSGEYGSIYANQPSGFSPPIPGNGVNPNAWPYYADQLRALLAAFGG